MRLVLELCYEGTAFFGWQIQKNQISVQQVIQEGLQQLCSRPIEIVGCGRTDTGVHAKKYYAHFDIEEHELCNLSVYKINAVLPQEIAITELYNVDDKFHARFDANHRKYIYKIHNRKDPFARQYSFYYNSISTEHLDSLNCIAEIIRQTSDFRTFAKSNSGLENFNCTVTECIWKVISDNEFEFHIAANRFVRGMVRLCVGACLSFAANKISLDELNEAIKSGTQLQKNWSVPAHGLSLTEVNYPDSIQLNKAIIQ
ncbi:MAG: tRNA pseudouridine synthase A [Saprospiraceae bacterium]